MTVVLPDGGVNALSGLQGARCRPGKHSATGHYAGWRASPPCPAYREHVVGPVSVAPPGTMPDDGVTALSGLQEARCRPGKRSATGHYAGMAA
ncbi:Uncharacterised protein [Citrobacter koseri]|uniref:Uncharacterized protein n=1 Tax=Citrobacter koseri TaxID=545 RepID=A0A2X2V7V4_CITKO|nr:Uncharacterised protein [Citrobacter koseri]